MQPFVKKIAEYDFAQEAVAHEAGWDDPAMDVYNDHPSVRKPKS